LIKILIDECLPIRLKNEYSEHKVFTVQEIGWQGKKDNDLLKLAVDERFEVFITIDKNIGYQQNTKKIKLGIIVLDVPRTKLENLKSMTKKVLELISKVKPYKVYRLKQDIDIKK
jgi:predicted nuclease of predicted toxin-antitoxin system